MTGASDPNGGTLSYSWNFGDGQNGSGQSTTHVYSNAGTFVVTVTVSNGVGTATTTAGITVRTNNAPTPGTVAVSRPTSIVGTTVTFTSQGAIDPDGQTLAFSWNFGDGTTGTGQSVGHAYSSTGTFNVVVTVSDGQLSRTATGVVVVKSLTATWRGTLIIDAVIFMTQSAASLTGTYNSIGRTGTITGSISATTRQVTFTVSVPGFASFTFAGDPDTDVNAISGTVNGSGFVNDAWTLRRQ